MNAKCFEAIRTCYNDNAFTENYHNDKCSCANACKLFNPMKELDDETIKAALREIQLKEMLQQEELKIQKRNKRNKRCLIAVLIVTLIAIAYFMWR